jgi:hypothetical protein
MSQAMELYSDSCEVAVLTVSRHTLAITGGTSSRTLKEVLSAGNPLSHSECPKKLFLCF